MSKTIKLKNITKKSALGTLLVLGIIGTDIGINQIQLNDLDHKASYNYYATQCWRDTGLQRGDENNEFDLMVDMFNTELESLPVEVKNMRIGIKQKHGLKKFCKAMIKLQ